MSVVDKEINEITLLINDAHLHDAEELIRKTIFENGETKELWLLLGYCVSQKEDKSELEKIFTSVLKLNPEDTEVRRGIVAIYEEIGNLEKAIEHQIEILHLNTSDYTARSKLIRFYEKVNEYKKAEEIYFDALKIEPNNSTIYADLGGFYDALHIYKDARICFNKVCELEKSDWYILAKTAQYFQKEGDLEKACEIYKRAIGFEENYKFVITYLAETLNELGNYSELLCLLNKYTSQTDNELLSHLDEDVTSIDDIHRLYALIGNCFKAQKQYRKAIEFYNLANEIERKQALENSYIDDYSINPTNCINIALCYEALECLDDALEVFDEFFPKGAEYGSSTHYHIGFFLFKHSLRANEAEEHIRTALKKSSCSPYLQQLAGAFFEKHSLENDTYDCHFFVSQFLEQDRRGMYIPNTRLCSIFPLPNFTKKSLLRLSEREQTQLTNILFFTSCHFTNLEDNLFLEEAWEYLNAFGEIKLNAFENAYPFLHVMGVFFVEIYKKYTLLRGRESSHNFTESHHWLFVDNVAETVHQGLLEGYRSNPDHHEYLEKAIPLLRATVELSISHNDPNTNFYVLDLAKTLFLQFKHKRDWETLRDVFFYVDQIIEQGYEQTLHDAYLDFAKTANILFRDFESLEPSEKNELNIFFDRLIDLGRRMRLVFCDWGMRQEQWMVVAEELGANSVFLKIFLSENDVPNEENIWEAVERLEFSLFQRLGDDLALNAVDLDRLKSHSFRGKKLASQYEDSLATWNNLLESRYEPEKKEQAPKLIREARNRVYSIANEIGRDRTLPLTFLSILSRDDIRKTAVTSKPIVYIMYSHMGGHVFIINNQKEPVLSNISHIFLPQLNNRNIDNIMNSYFVSYGNYVEKYNTKWLSSTRTLEDEKIVFQSFSDFLTSMDTVLNELWSIVIEPINTALNKLQIRQITLIPYGKLSLIPLHAVYCENVFGRLIKKIFNSLNFRNNFFKGRAYFLDNITVSYAPAARLLLLNQSRFKNMLKPENEIECWYSSKNNEHHDLFQKETCAINELFSFSSRRPLLNRPNEILNSMSRAPFFQFSGHSRTKQENFLKKSGLKIGENEDDILPIIQILKSRFENLRFAFLSSCEGGLRDMYIPNEGACISTALLYSGAGGCASPFHIVSTEATAQIVPEFWKHVANNTSSDFYDGAKYLREVQLGVRKGKLKIKFENRDGLYASQNVKHPFYWAGFYWNGL